MNEALLNFMCADLTTEVGRTFCERVLDFMRDRLLQYQEQTGQMFNLEATPAEGTSYRFALLDRARYPDIMAANQRSADGEPYYTNSTQLPVDATDDLFQALDWQDNIQTKYTGGTVVHVFLGERLPSVKATKDLVRRVANQYRLPTLLLTPTFSVCLCTATWQASTTPAQVPGRAALRVYFRVVGYLRPAAAVEQGQKGRSTRSQGLCRGAAPARWRWRRRTAIGG